MPPGRKTKQDPGRDAERNARKFLEDAGLVFRHANFRSRFGELDLVMEDAGTIVFVEVRMRRNSRFGGAAASVSITKQRKLIATAAIYLEAHAVGHCPARFDIVAFDGLDARPQWLRDAFRPQ